VVDFLKIFKTATQLLGRGSKYPTTSLVLLFRTEIVAALQDLPIDCAMMTSMKQRMRQALRLLVTEFKIIGALLDPFQRSLTVVQDFLVAQNTTAFHLLFQSMDKLTGVQQLQANNNLSGMNEAASTYMSLPSLQFHGKRQKKTCCRNMSILKTQVIEKFSCIDACRLHTMKFWLDGNHKKISNPGCHCSP